MKENLLGRLRVKKWECIANSWAARPLRIGLLLAALLPFRGLAQPSANVQTGGPTTAPTTNYTIVSQSPNSRIWQQVVTGGTNLQGQVSSNTQSYTELKTGMYHQVGTNLVESSDNITITAAGGVATNAAHTVGFATDINSSNAVEIITPDGKDLKTHIMGVSFLDSATGSNVLFAEIKDSTGLLMKSNEVVYPNAFAGANMDVRYDNTISSIEQDIVIREQLPSPSAYGLSPATTWLQVWTEFLDPPTPTITSAGVGGDITLQFGGMAMSRGRAFIMGDESNSVTVTKQWLTIQGRTFLVEGVPLNAVAASLQTLPPPSGNGTKTGQQSRLQGFPRMLPPKPVLAQRNGDGLKLATAPAPESKGLVMDYMALSVNATNYTFQGDTTYFVTGRIALSGNTTVEGGTVIKFTNGNSIPYLEIEGPLICKTGPYQPGVFTTMDDNSMGQIIPGSSGTPVVGSCYDMVLASTNIRSVNGMRFNYAQTGILPFINAELSISNCQFGYCEYGVRNDSLSNLHLRNILFASNAVSADFTQNASMAFTAENVTSDSTNFWQYTLYQPTMALTNCIILGSFATPTSLSTNCTVIDPAGTVFQIAGAGDYYLTTNSPYRAAGTTNVDPTLLANLALRTTYPPILPSTFTSDDIPLNTVNVTESPQAGRDNSGINLDYGYHYDPIDYMTTPWFSNATVTLTNGVVIGYWRNLGFLMDNGSAAISQGTATVHNVITYYNLVQEQPTVLSGYSGYPEYTCPFDCWHTDSTRDPGITLNFTSVYGPQTALNLIPLYPDFQLSPFTLQNSELYGAGSQIEFYYDTGTVFDFQNNLFQYLNLYGYGYGNFNGFNNLYRGGSNYTYTYQMYAYGSSVITNRDNAFDDTVFYSSGTIGYNAFLNGATDDNTLLASDIVTNLTWQSSWLGNFYQPTNSPLIAKGSRSAPAAGLYHFTVLTNQTIEGNATNVTVGYHYVAVDGNGNPLDTNGDGIPDYLEDVNGNGVVDSGEIDWQVAGDLGLQVIITKPANNSVIP